MFATPSKPIDVEKQDSSFPKRSRLLRPPEFRRVYDNGRRISGAYFSAFFLASGGEEYSRVGLTVPKAIGKSVTRNRLKRRMREAVRLNLGQLGRGWMIVVNPRRAALDAPLDALSREVGTLFARCGS